MFGSRLGIVLFALLAFLSGSRAAWLCTEADGTVCIEFVGAPCCDGGPGALGGAEGGIGAAACARCDDRPLVDPSTRRDDDGQAHPLAAPVAEAFCTESMAGVAVVCTPSSGARCSRPRAARPAILRC